MAWLLLGAAPLAALTLEVRVDGLDGRERANVLALLDIHQERAQAGLSPARLRALHQRAPAQIRAALAPFGYYQVEVEARLEEPPTEAGRWLARYRVDPGPPTRIATLDYRLAGPGAEDAVFPRTLGLEVGDVLLHAAYEQAKARLRQGASSGGYLDAQLARHQVLVDPSANAAHVSLHLDTGPRYFFGPLSFRQDLLDEALLRRYVTLEPGEVYDPDRLLALQSRLLGTDYFSAVEMRPQKEASDASGRIPIEVVAERNAANKFRFGLGYATDVGPRFSMDWRRRYLNRWGHRFRTELSLAPGLSYWNLDYRIPVGNPVRDYVVIKPQSSYQDGATREGWVHSLQVAHSSLTPSGWRRTLGLDYRYEDLALDGSGLDATHALVPTASWSRTRADDPINTNRGYSLKYSLLGTVGGLFSEDSYLSGRVQFKWVRRFARDYRLIARTDLGATLAEDLESLPASRRFYAGGDNSIRGWGFEALGPTDPDTDETLGGRYLAVGSLELERRIRGPWSAALFTDLGNAFDPDAERRIEQSLGLGLRWASPIGQVRLDLAFALTKDDENGGLPPARLHLVIGPDL